MLKMLNIKLINKINFLAYDYYFHYEISRQKIEELAAVIDRWLRVLN